MPDRRCAGEVVEHGREHRLLERRLGERRPAERDARQRLDVAAGPALLGESGPQFLAEELSEFARQCRRRRAQPLER
jgi:hypothetical protein